MSVNRAWAEMVKRSKPEQKQEKQVERSANPNKQVRVMLPEQLTPRALKVTFDSLFSAVPLELLDCEVQQFTIDDDRVFLCIKNRQEQ
jgi:hypothetical protein